MADRSSTESFALPGSTIAAAALGTDTPVAFPISSCVGTNKNGIPAYRHTVFSTANNDLLHKKLEDLLDIGIYECEKYYPAFHIILFEDTKTQEALKLCTIDTVGSA